MTLGQVKDFRNKTHFKERIVKKKIGMFDYMNFFKFHYTKDTIHKVKR